MSHTRTKLLFLEWTVCYNSFWIHVYSVCHQVVTLIPPLGFFPGYQPATTWTTMEPTCLAQQVREYDAVTIHTQTQTHTQTHTDRHTQAHTGTHRHTQTHTDTHKTLFCLSFHKRRRPGGASNVATAAQILARPLHTFNNCHSVSMHTAIHTLLSPFLRSFLPSSLPQKLVRNKFIEGRDTSYSAWISCSKT